MNVLNYRFIRSRSQLYKTSLHLFSPPPPPPLSPPPLAMGKKTNAQPKSNPDHPKDEAYLQSVIPKCISLFESIQSQPLSHRQSVSGDLIKITLPDGTVKEFGCKCSNFSSEWSSLGHVEASRK